MTFGYLRKKKEKISGIFENIVEKHNLKDISDQSVREIKMKLSSFCTKIDEKWNRIGKTHWRFSDWLNKEPLLFNVKIIKVHNLSMMNQNLLKIPAGD